MARDAGREKPRSTWARKLVPLDGGRTRVVTCEAKNERTVKRSAAMLDVIRKEQRRVSQLILERNDAWQKDQQRHLTDAAAPYRAAIVALDQTRQPTAALAGDRRLVDPLTGRPEPVPVPQPWRG